MEEQKIKELEDHICALQEQIDELKNKVVSDAEVIKEKELLIWNLRAVLKAIA